MLYQYSINPPYPIPRHFYCGKTLIELLIAMGICALLATIAVPSFYTTLHSNQSDTLIHDLARTIQAARQWAVSGKSIVSLCPYATTGCGKDWQQGIMLFTDPNNDGVLDEDERLLQVFLLPAHYQLHWRASAGKTYLRFSPTGMARQFGKFHLCSMSGDMRFARTLVLNRQGRLKQYRDTDHDGIVNDGKGKLPECPAG